MTAEEWLEKNAFECVALSARISPQACATYRKGHTSMHNHVQMVPLQCQGCTSYPQEAQPMKRRRKAPASATKAKVQPRTKAQPKRAPQAAGVAKDEIERKLELSARRGNRASAALLERLKS